jgi:hypothetical protein
VVGHPLECRRRVLPVCGLRRHALEEGVHPDDVVAPGLRAEVHRHHEAQLPGVVAALAVPAVDGEVQRRQQDVVDGDALGPVADEAGGEVVVDPTVDEPPGEVVPVAAGGDARWWSNRVPEVPRGVPDAGRLPGERGGPDVVEGRPGLLVADRVAPGVGPPVGGTDRPEQPHPAHAVGGDVAVTQEQPVAARRARPAGKEQPERRVPGREVEGVAVEGPPDGAEVLAGDVDDLEGDLLDAFGYLPDVAGLPAVVWPSTGPREGVDRAGVGGGLPEGVDVDPGRRLDLELDVPGDRLPLEVLHRRLDGRERRSPGRLRGSYREFGPAKLVT